MNLRTRYSLLAALITLACGCAVFQNKLKAMRPEVSLRTVDLAAIDFEGVDLDFHYDIKDKSGFPLTLTRTAYGITLDGKKVVTADNKTDFKLKANAVTPYTLRQRVSYSAFGAVMDLFRKDTVKARLDGKLGILIAKELGSVEVPITAEKEFGLPKLPSVSFRTLSFKKLDVNPLRPFDSKAIFELSFDVKNNAVIPLKIDGVGYDFRLDSVSLLNGRSNPLDLKSSASETLRIPLELKGQTAIDLTPKLRELSKAKYTFDADIAMNFGGAAHKLPFRYP